MSADRGGAVRRPPGVAGYNLYRRTAAGAYNFSSPVNGATVLTGTSYADPGSGLANGTSCVYAVRAMIVGAGSAQAESVSSNDGSPATSDSTAPSAATDLSATSGDPVQATAICSVVAGTRFINNAGKASVSLTVTIPTPETGETVVFSATTPGSTPVTVTVVAGGTSVTGAINLSTLLDGTVTVPGTSPAICRRRRRRPTRSSRTPSPPPRPI